MKGIVPLSQIEPGEVEWYFFPRIPFGAITLVFGAAGIGKSTMMYDILARASRGDRMPMSAELPKPPHDVENAKSLIIGTEDTTERVASVLDRAGASMDYIGIVPQANLPDPKQSPLEQLVFIEDQMNRFGAKVLYVDNMSEALTSTTDSSNERSVRQALHPLDLMAKRNGFVVLITTHPKKGAGYGPITEAISGSQGFVNLARSVIYVDRVPHSDQMAMAVAKSNYFPCGRINTLSFQVKSEVIGHHDGHDVLSTPYLDWRGIVPYTAQQLATENARIETDRARAAGKDER